jgi:hypothetical protein
MIHLDFSILNRSSARSSARHMPRSRYTCMLLDGRHKIIIVTILGRFRSTSCTFFYYCEPVQMYQQHEKAQSMTLLWGLEEVDLEADLVHLQQLEQGMQEDQVSMSLDWCSK